MTLFGTSIVITVLN